jgi:fumarate reductase flavoprotein subunit
MSNPRTWFAADKTGFHMLHTLFQESLRHTLTTADSRDSAAPSIIRYDEHIALDLLMSDGGGARGIVAYDQQQGHVVAFVAPAVILATGGAARAWGTSTNAGIVTGDGLSMALRAGLALRDIEFVQVHPTCLPATGILITEAARGEGGVLLDRNGDRYLADYGLGPVTPVGQPVPRTMELGPRDRLSQAFWKADRDGRTIPWHDGADGAAGSVGAAGGGETDAASGTSAGARRNVVHLDLRHVGDFLLKTRLPLVTGLARRYVGVDPRFGLIPVCPAAHYTMGGIPTTPQGQVLDGAGQAVPGLYAAGECASTGLHGANRLGSNSLVETLVVGRAAGALAAGDTGSFDGLSASPRYSTTDKALTDQAEALAQPWLAMRGQGSESPAHIRRDLGALLDADVGIYCDADGLARARASIDSLRQRFADVRVADTSSVFNTDWAQALQVGAMLDVAAAVVAAAEGRHESRGAHQRIDHPDADAAPKHSIVVTGQTGVPEVSYV